MEKPACVFSDQQHVSIKNSLYHAIKKGDLERVRKMMRLFSIEPTEEISTFGSSWNPLHYAVFFRKPLILEFLIQLSYQKHLGDEAGFVQIMNSPTKTGHSVFMVASVYDATECLEILFKYGGFHLFKKDQSAMNSQQLALKYDSKNAHDMIQTQIALNEFKDFLPIQTEAFKTTPDLKTLLLQRYEVFMEQDVYKKHRDLLLYGEPLSCLICLQNTGFLKYSNCCGQPLHQHCHAEKIMQCPHCKSNYFYLISEVLYPERAFSLDPTKDYINIEMPKQKEDLDQVKPSQEISSLPEE